MDDSRMTQSDIAIFKIAAVRNNEFSKFAILVYKQNLTWILD